MTTKFQAPSLEEGLRFTLEEKILWMESLVPLDNRSGPALFTAIMAKSAWEERLDKERQKLQSNRSQLSVTTFNERWQALEDMTNIVDRVILEFIERKSGSHARELMAIHLKMS